MAIIHRKQYRLEYARKTLRSNIILQKNTSDIRGAKKAKSTNRYGKLI
jgi:hypothetical protein